MNGELVPIGPREETLFELFALGFYSGAILLLFVVLAIVA